MKQNHGSVPGEGKSEITAYTPGLKAVLPALDDLERTYGGAKTHDELFQSAQKIIVDAPLPTELKEEALRILNSVQDERQPKQAIGEVKRQLSKCGIYRTLDAYFNRKLFGFIATIMIATFAAMTASLVEDLGVAVQRSGSLLVGGAALVEYIYGTKIHKILRPPGGGFATTFQTSSRRTEYSRRYENYMRFLIAMMVTGTLCWGYGDLLYQLG